jgi:hypothetical protein
MWDGERFPRGTGRSVWLKQEKKKASARLAKVILEAM